MENEDYPPQMPELPSPQPGNTTEEICELYQEADRQLKGLLHEIQQAYGGQESSWDNRVHATRPDGAEQEHIIGIIGATGAGKSALINALVDEETLVPTSCMQACTATIIEIAYNKCPTHEYRAVIQFVSREKWRNELDNFYKYFVNAEKDDLADVGSGAAVAFAKITAIYPDLDQNTLSSSTAEELMARPNLEVLGTTLEINASTSHDLHTQLQKYVESQEKSQASSESIQTAPSDGWDEMECWPLVEKVRIFTQAAVLKTGCVLVDLPGTFDVNAARASIAKDYLARCASVWIVVPVWRAVDDKVGQSLLDDSLKFQLRRDGALGKVIMVCSKSDQLVIKELKGKLKHNSTLQECLREHTAYTKELADSKNKVSGNLKKAEKAIENISEKTQTLEVEVETYSKLLQLAKDGTVVHPPVFNAAKRKSAARDFFTPRKQPRLDRITRSTFSQICAGDSDDQSDGEQAHRSKEMDTGTTNIRQDTTRPAVGVTELQSKVDTINNSLEKLRKDLSSHNRTLRQENKKLQQILEWDSILDYQEWIAYYKARNQQITKQLQADFRTGIRQLERTEHEADDDFNPTATTTSSIEQQPDLPVFCVASQGFQKLRGRFEKEGFSGKFNDVDETGIPELMRYCIGIGENDIAARRKVFATRVCQLLNSVVILLNNQNVSRDDVSIVPTDNSLTILQLTEAFIQDLTISFQDLAVKIDSQVDSVIDVVTKAAKAGESQTMQTVQGWAAPLISAVPGLHHSTYRAVLRRGGVYVNAKRSINWPEELEGPMMQVIDFHWNYAFNCVIPIALKGTEEKCTQLIRCYLKALGSSDEFFCATREDRGMFKRQFEGLKTTTKSLLNSTRQEISQQLKRANRILGNTIESQLGPVCFELAADRGCGVFTRNKRALEKAMDSMKQEMFIDAAVQVTVSLENCRDDYREPMLDSLAEMLSEREQDCQRLFGKETQNLVGLTAERKNEIVRIIRDMEKLLDIKAEDLKKEPTPELKNEEDNPNADDGLVKEEIFTQPATDVLAARSSVSPSESSALGKAEESCEVPPDPAAFELPGDEAEFPDSHRLPWC